MRSSDWSSDVCSSDLIGPQERKSLQSEGTLNCAPEAPLQPSCQWDKKAIADRHNHRPKCGNQVLTAAPSAKQSLGGVARIGVSASTTRVGVGRAQGTQNGKRTEEGRGGKEGGSTEQSRGGRK